jgi:hypothetical protein
MHVQPSWENKLLFPPVIKAKRREPPMNSRLAALVKHVAELHEAKHKACHCIEEFHLRRIRPLGHECLQKADPNCEPTDGKLSILSLKYWGYYYPDLTLLLSCVVLSQEEID